MHLKTKQKNKKHNLFNFNLLTVSIVVGGLFLFSGKWTFGLQFIKKNQLYISKEKKTHFKHYYFLGKSFINLKLKKKKSGENSSIKARDIFKMSS